MSLFRTRVWSWTKVELQAVAYPSLHQRYPTHVLEKKGDAKTWLKSQGTRGQGESEANRSQFFKNLWPFLHLLWNLIDREQLVHYFHRILTKWTQTTFHFNGKLSHTAPSRPVPWRGVGDEGMLREWAWRHSYAPPGDSGKEACVMWNLKKRVFNSYNFPPV